MSKILKNAPKTTTANAEIYLAALRDIKKSHVGYSISWHLRLEFNNKYSTAKINYEP